MVPSGPGESSAGRLDRRFPEPPKADDDRSPPERDRDRLLYSTAFRRLAEVTQVVSRSGGYVFHNRLTHSLKVAQVGRASATWLCTTDAEAATAVGGIDPFVVEAAALAHDLGHPPFGHLAERELHALLSAMPIGLSDGYEGNAQSFRIVTKREVHNPDRDGLNLTRATLNALLKYPWTRGEEGQRARKWGAYESERQDFIWARAGEADTETRALQSAEAALMDWADDVAYSVHDVEDFYRAGLIPLHELRRAGAEQRAFLAGALRRLEGQTPYSNEELAAAFTGLAELFPIVDAFTGTRWQRAGLRSFTSNLIGSYVRAVRLTPDAPDRRVAIDPEREKEVLMLKELTWHYVILNPALATQQYGQRRVIADLFHAYMDAASRPKDWHMFPAAYREHLEAGADEGTAHARVVADFIAAMTEDQAYALHGQLIGLPGPSGLDRFGP